jgi:hypothetical protein
MIYADNGGKGNEVCECQVYRVRGFKKNEKEVS